MEKKLLFQLSDGEDVSGIVMGLTGCVQWIKADIEDAKETDDIKEYTLTPIWLTDKEFKNFPEADI